MPQDTKQHAPAAESPEVAAMQGLRIDDTDVNRLWGAVEAAFHYRGDVELTLRDRPAPLEGYLFDRTERQPLSESLLRIIAKDSDERHVLRLGDVHAITFSGKNTAAGRTFESWMKRYVERKLAGKKASIESESLESTG